MSRRPLPPLPTIGGGKREAVEERFREAVGSGGKQSRPGCALCDSGGWHGWQHERYVYAAPEYREQMVREHYPYDCGPALVREGGRWYPVEYLALLIREGEEDLSLDDEGRRTVEMFMEWPGWSQPWPMTKEA